MLARPLDKVTPYTTVGRHGRVRLLGGHPAWFDGDDRSHGLRLPPGDFDREAVLLSDPRYAPYEELRYRND